MRLQNIYNYGRVIYLFCRNTQDKLEIKKDQSFYPYYYEPSEQGEYRTYDNKMAKKIILSNPWEVGKLRTAQSYESDILYPKRYLIDRVPLIEKSVTKYIFLDIETCSKEFPDIMMATDIISCITIYNSADQQYVTWFLPEWGMNESEMLDDFVSYIAAEQPDLLSAWNVEFDYTYLYNRCKTMLNSKTTFAELISPIKMTRPGKMETYYPAGISIVDYKGFYEKLTLNKKRSYALDYIAQEDLEEISWGDTTFGEMTAHVKEKNINDVRRMVSIEERSKVIPHFDEIRRFAKCYWEDLPQETTRKNGKLEKQSNNSKVIDMIVLQEARKLGIVLPKKPEEHEEFEFEGAYRDTLQTGKFEDVGKYDLSGAYMKAVTDLCLDSSNLRTEQDYMDNGKDIVAVSVSDRKTREIAATYFIKQNKNALLPISIERLIGERNKYRSLLKSTPPNAPEYEDIDQKYKAIKSLVLSSWGVIGNKYFRLYDHRIASMITSIVRDLLHYVEEETVKLGYPVIYVDTDSVFALDKGRDISADLNQMIQTWCKTRFGAGVTSTINFEYEGHFDRVLILTKCHYYGYLKGKTKPEIKGVEVKKSSSSKYEAKFQDTLINKVLNNETKQQVTQWVLEEQQRIKTLPVQEISFPAKITNDNYKNEPIFLRAYENSQRIFKLKLERGNLFYYMFVRSIGSSSNGKDIDVVAFTADQNVFENESIPLRIDWSQVIRRNITGKVESVFEVMHWGNVKNALIGQTALF